MYGRSWRLLAFFLIALTAVVVSAQSQSPERGLDFALPVSPPVGHIPRVGSPRVYDLPQLAAAAGTIFSGTVTSIARRPATRGQPIETVAITFHVRDGHSRRHSRRGFHHLAMDWSMVWRPALSGRGAAAPFSLCSQQIGTDQLRRRRSRTLQPRSRRRRSAFRATTFCLSKRSRPGWEIAVSFERFRRGGAARQWGGMSLC